MKTIYILLTRSGTLLSNLVYAVTGANYTHASLAFDEDLSCLYSSTRKNGYTMFPAGPSREYLNRGVFRLRENVPCALYALDVSDEAYTRARRRAEHMMAHGSLYQFNVIGLALCGMHIRWKRRRHYFCSQFVSEVLQKSGAGAAKAQHPHAPQRLRRAARAALPLPRYAGRPAPAPEHGAGRGGERHGPLPERPSGGREGQSASAVLIFSKFLLKN